MGSPSSLTRPYFIHMIRESFPVRYTDEEGLDIRSIPPRDSAVRRINTYYFRNEEFLSRERFQSALRDALANRWPMRFSRIRHLSERTMARVNGITDVLVNLFDITIYWHSPTGEGSDGETDPSS